jgi:hypothetical protein
MRTGAKMDPVKLPSDVERIKKFIEMLGWVPKKFGEGKEKYDVEYSNGTFYMNYEKTGSARMHIEYEDFYDEPDDDNEEGQKAIE